MPEERIARVDFCKGPVARERLNLRTPLDTVVPIGITAVGCRPAVAHHRASNGAIVSRVDQKSLNYVSPLLTVDAEDDSNPEVTPAIAGLPRAVMSGTAVLPYPASPLGYEVLFDVNDLPQFRDIAELTPTNVGNLINADGHSVSEVSGGVYRDVLLGGPVRFNGQSVFLAYHTYEYGVQYVVCPNGEPTILRYDANVPEYVWPGLATFREGVAISRKVNPLQPNTLPQYVVQIVIWEATPAFASFMDGEQLEPSGFSATHNQANGPLLGRKYVFHPFQTATMPAYGEAYTASHAIAGARANLILWANADMDSVVINGDVGTLLSPGSAPISRLPTVLNGPTNTEYQVHSFPKAFQYAIDPYEDMFSILMNAFGGEIFDATASPFTFGSDDTIPRWYEGVALAFIQTT